MKRLKFICVFILIALTLTLAVNAQHLGEEDVIGKTLTVEKDTNIVKENIDKDKNLPEGNNTYQVVMTKTEFFNRCTLPALLLFSLGALTAFALKYKDNRVAKRKNIAE